MKNKKVIKSMVVTPTNPSDLFLHSEIEGFLKRGNFLNTYTGKIYCMVVDNYLYTGQSKQKVKETINLKEAWLDE